MHTIDERLRAAEERNDEWIATALLADPTLDPKDATPEHLSKRILGLLAENARLKVHAPRSGSLTALDEYLAMVRQEIATLQPDPEEGPLELYARLLREVNGLFELVLSEVSDRDRVRAQTTKIAAFAFVLFGTCP